MPTIRATPTILISVNGELLPREKAVVSVFDSGFVLGDGVWEGLRLIEGGIAFLDAHLDRLYEGAKAIDMDIGLTRAELAERLFACLRANAMRDGVHIRLMVTRGVKRTPYQDPRVTIGPATVVIIPEYKLPKPEVVDNGITLFTVHVRRTGPAEQDQKLNSHSKLNCILACIQATKAGADEALMLDPAGFVATCNSTHFFIVRKRRGLDLAARILPRRHHPRKHPAGRARGRHPGVRETLFADRRLWRRRSLRHRHLRRPGPGQGRRRTHDRRRPAQPPGDRRSFARSTRLSPCAR